MQQIDTKTLNKNFTLKDIQYINSNCCWEIQNILITPHLFYTNILVQKHNKFVLNKTTCPTFNFEATCIHHHSCPSLHKLPND
jgi:5'(3')-deoxyribonucleotidase